MKEGNEAGKNNQSTKEAEPEKDSKKSKGQKTQVSYKSKLLGMEENEFEQDLETQMAEWLREEKELNPTTKDAA